MYDGCSFEFWPDKYDVEEREGKVPLVRHTHFRAITALTLGMDPAYLQTSLHARELYDETPAGKKAKQEAEAQKQREQQEKQEAMQREMNRRVKHLQRLADFERNIE